MSILVVRNEMIKVRRKRKRDTKIIEGTRSGPYIRRFRKNQLLLAFIGVQLIEKKPKDSSSYPFPCTTKKYSPHLRARFKIIYLALNLLYF